jgi:hypothetical protein
MKFTVPLDHDGHVEGQLSIFVREAVCFLKTQEKQPYLLYLQGMSLLVLSTLQILFVWLQTVF